MEVATICSRFKYKMGRTSTWQNVTQCR